MTSSSSTTVDPTRSSGANSADCVNAGTRDSRKESTIRSTYSSMSGITHRKAEPPNALLIKSIIQKKQP
jgi:hypothetical protein